MPRSGTNDQTYVHDPLSSDAGSNRLESTQIGESLEQSKARKRAESHQESFSEVSLPE
ncbi:hypothetical protein ACFFK0_11795 [Paenibacillus chartarius]|uniref:Uncharacterized protein n=1 Tax=Paenibacillus chartarius TaxID=747481 RepID=A0ABV6DKH5_9BACL